MCEFHSNENYIDELKLKNIEFIKNSDEQINEKIAYNGNKLFFFEPLQALTLHFVLDFALLINEYLNDRQEYKRNEINQSLLKKTIKNFELEYRI